MQCIRSPPAPEAAFWGRCSGFCRTEIQEVTESFLMHLRQEHGFDLTKPYLSKTKATSSHTLFEQQNTTVALRRKTVLFFFTFFFSSEKIIFKGKKLLHIVSEERRSSIWSWPSSFLEGVCETFQLEKVWAWNQKMVWGHLSLLSQLFYGAVQNGEPPLTFLR